MGGNLQSMAIEPISQLYYELPTIIVVSVIIWQFINSKLTKIDKLAIEKTELDNRVTRLETLQGIGQEIDTSQLNKKENTN